MNHEPKTHNQTGFAPIFIIAIAVVIAVAVLIIGGYVSNQSEKDSKPVNNQSVSKEKDCSDSYGGCDKDKNFYKWTDDGLP